MEYNKELAERITKAGQEILSTLPGVDGIKNNTNIIRQYKLLGWSQNLFDAAA